MTNGASNLSATTEVRAQLFLLAEIHNRLAAIAEHFGAGKQLMIAWDFEPDGSFR